MKNIVFLSCSKLEGFVADDHLIAQELENQGYKVSTLAWDASASWGEFDGAIIRTTWDYTQRLDEYLKKLELISLQTKLFNPLAIVKWNCHKKYLQEMFEKNIKIVPTHFFSFPGRIDIPTNWQMNKFIIKPAISASAFKTMIVKRSDILENKIQSELFSGDWMLQPFLEVIKEGEISLHYFNGKFSHAIKKVPKAGDFRVQEEHGGDIQALHPDQSLLDLGEKIIRAVPQVLLYARVDLVAFENSYALMELELIEPALYFRTNPSSVKNFSSAFKTLCPLSDK